MVFSSVFFITVFFPVVLLGFMLCPQKMRNLWLLISSIYFYYIGSGTYVLLLFSVVLICYISAMALSYVNGNGRRIMLFVFLLTLIMLLSYFKYSNFLLSNIQGVLNKDINPIEIALPIGISFYIFQGISYIVDVYRGEEPIYNLVDMALYISNFPQLVAGPIVRYSDIKNQIAVHNRIFKMDNYAEGIWRFSIGLSKKVILANNMGGCCDLLFDSGFVNQYSVAYAWLGAVLYTLQIYFDFSGYSDMAIGLGKCFGFTYHENFDYPYMSKSVTEFWRRWHISLSSWLRDYVYIPLGGSKATNVRWIRNMFIVWALTGLWHGASWNFIVWGLGYFIVLLFEKKFLILKKRNAGRLVLNQSLTPFYA